MKMLALGRRVTCGWMLPLIALLLLATFSSIVIGSGLTRSAAQDTKVIYVDQANVDADDGNLGTSSQPLSTLGGAISLAETYNAESLPVRIVIRPGIYRETVELTDGAGTTSAPVSVEGAQPGVVVSGSDVWNDWEGGMDGVYSHTWPYDWGLAPLPDTWPDHARAYLNENPIIQRSEMVFVDGDPLLQVLTDEELRTTQNTFFVSEETDQLFIKLPEDWDATTAEVEVSVRTKLLSIGSRQNVSILNITFQHAAAPLTSSTVSISNSENANVTESRLHISLEANELSAAV